MNILFVTQEYPPHVYGGISIILYNLIKELIRLYGKKIVVHILTIDGMTSIGSGFPELPITVHRLPVLTEHHPFRTYEFIVKAHRFLKKNYSDFDIIHDNTNFIVFDKKPVLSTVHTTMLQEALYCGENKKITDFLARHSMLLFRTFENQSFKKAKYLHLYSNAMRKHIQQYFPDCAETKFSYLGVDNMLFRKLDINPDYDVAYIGRLAPRKGLKKLFDVLSSIKDRKLHILICGAVPGYRRSIIKNMFSGLSHSVTLLQNKSYYDLPDIYNRAKIIVLFSQFESFGMTVTEAMACERPVISTRVGALPEIIDNEENGLLFAYKDTIGLSKGICSLLDNQKKREVMGINARAHVVKNFQWEKTANDLFSIYKQLLIKNND